MKRTNYSQTKHNREVRRIANSYRRRGFSVEADIKGFDQPSPINRRRPDVVATKGSKKSIVEVETRDTVDADKGQCKVFQDHANKSKNTYFWKKVV